MRTTKITWRACLTAASTALSRQIATTSAHDPRASEVSATRDERLLTIVAKPGIVLAIASVDLRDVLLLRMTPQDADLARRIEAGATVDVLIGDDAFDRAFHIEGAPADVVREVLTTTAIRTFLLRHPTSVVELRERAAGAEVRHYFLHLEATDVADVLGGVTALAKRIEEVTRAAEALRARPVDEGSYRGDGGTRALVLGNEARREVSRLALMRSRGDIVFPASMVISGAAYVGAVLWYAVPWPFLMLTVVAAVLGGIPLYIGIELVGEVSGLSPRIRRYRLRRRR